MEKYGVSQEELKEELRAKYADLTAQRREELTKTAHAGGSAKLKELEDECEAVAAKITAMEQTNQ